MVPLLHPAIKVNFFEIKSKLDLFKAAQFVKKYIKENTIDAIHAHMVDAIMIAKLARVKHIPLFITYHSVVFRRFKKNGMITFPYLVHVLSNKKNQISIGVSNTVLNIFRTQYGGTQKEALLYNFINEDFFNRISEKKSHSNFTLTWVGNIRADKNFDVLVNAFDLDLKNDNNIVTDVWGENRSNIDYEQLLNQKQIHNLRLLGNTKEIPTVLPQYNLFLSTSLNESFGLAVMEAMALKVPVLLSDIPAYRELYNGMALFFKPDDPKDLVKKIKYAQQSPKELQQLSSTAFEFVKKFTLQNHLVELKKIYEKYIK